MIERSEWARAHYAKLQDDPYYVAAAIGLSVSDFIHMRMKQRHITIVELARRTNRSRNTISRWLQAIHTVKMVDVIHLLAEVEREAK